MRARRAAAAKGVDADDGGRVRKERNRKDHQAVHQLKVKENPASDQTTASESTGTTDLKKRTLTLIQLWIGIVNNFLAAFSDRFSRIA
jgi:hypothetical protein